jgi:hypothetical protein
MRLGPGQVVLDDLGRPVAFRHDRLPGLGFLLGEGDTWHTADRAWGAGFAVTGRGAVQWSVPDDHTVAEAAATQRFRLLDGLALHVERRAGDRLRETYRWANTGDTPLEITSLAVSTPWRDVYAADGVAQETAVHAHLSASGAQAWALAKPMHGQGPFLGLTVREGAVRAYSVEARNQFTGSNVRGHLLLHVTDEARHRHAFGGQPALTLAPGASYRLVWELAWFEDEAAFLALAEPTVVVPELAAVVGTTLRIRHPATMRVRVSPSGVPLTGADPGRARRDLAVEPAPDGSAVTGRAHGVVELDVGPDGGDAVRVGLLFHRPLAELVRRRVAVLLDRHRPRQRPRPRGFVACDTRTGLTVTDQGWPDWSDGAERTAMPVLLAEARARGLVEAARAAEVDDALEEFTAFAAGRLVGPDGWVRRGSTDVSSDPRLYNTPWLVDLLVLQHGHDGRLDHLELACSLLEASARHGVDRHLSIGHPQAMLALEAAVGRLPGPAVRALRPRVGRLVDGLRTQALGLAGRGGDLPAHEVSYEQSIVAPLVSLLSLAHRRWPDRRLLDAAGQALGWLLAFAGRQRHVRLRHVAIRHWDGYWFGLRRQWGDTFPHYWSALTAVALLELPDELRPEGHDRMAEAILRANLASYDEHGRGCCAFLYPSCVDGVPAHGPDPLDNDQDWALVHALRSGLVP